jgi:Xaa-Pro dipeptidase
MDERSLRVAAAAAESGASWALLTSVDAVCYATGHEPSIEAGPSPFAGGPSTAVVAADGTSGVVLTNLEQPAAETGYAQVMTAYEGFGSQEQAALLENYQRAVLDTVKTLEVNGPVAVEPMTLPLSLRVLLEEMRSSTVDITPALSRHRATKTEAEIELLRESARLTGIGQEAALRAVAAGRAELEAFADIRCAMELAAGGRLALTGDLISGAARTAAAMGWPGSRRISEGEPVICDLAPRRMGYWGDSCNTLVVGEPTEAFLELYDVARRALDHAIESLRPGITAAEFDAGVREIITRAGFENPLHIGHGIGTSSHEFPRLVPRERAVLAQDMVLMVEPGAYKAGIGGARLEWMFRLTATGSEVLSPFRHLLRSDA